MTSTQRFLRSVFGNSSSSGKNLQIIAIQEAVSAFLLRGTSASTQSNRGELTCDLNERHSVDNWVLPGSGVNLMDIPKNGRKSRVSLKVFCSSRSIFQSYRLSPPAALAYELKQIALIAPGMMQMPSKEAAELQHSREFIEKQNTAVVRQTRMTESDFYISGRSTHSDFNVPKGEVKVSKRKR